MTVSKADMLHEASMAFDAGDHRRGSALVHEVLKQDINHDAAWKLLYAALNRKEPFEAFQQDFVLRYYPEQADQFQVNNAQGSQKPLRRVSLGIKKPEPARLKHVSLVDLPSPQKPALKSRQVSAEAPRQRQAVPDGGEVQDVESPPEKFLPDEAPERPGLFRRIGNFLRRFVPRRSPGEGAPGAPEDQNQDKESEPPEDPASLLKSDSMLAPLSLKDLPKKQGPPQPESGANARSPAERRQSAAPLLTKFHEERYEIRLIIADDIPQTRENIRKLLLFEPSVDVVAVAANGEEAIQLAMEHQPDIVLMDINMPGMDGLEALKTIREALPLTQVVMLTVQDDPGYLREALQLGARDYLIKPPTIDELLETIQNTHEIGRAERERFERMNAPPESPDEEFEDDVDGTAIAVYSPKGGVGCTFIASNLAVALQNESQHVVLVDCDLEFGGVGLFFNEQARVSIRDLAARVHDMDPNLLRDAIILNQDSGIRLVLAPSSPEDAERVTGEQLAALIRYLRSRFAFVVADTGSVMDVHAAAVLSECDEVLMVTTQDIPAINNLRLTLDFAPQIGVHDARISLVLNMYHKRVNITAEQISANLKREFAAVIPMDNRTAIPSINRGVPFMTSPESRSLPIGAAFLQLADSVRKRELVAV